MPKPRATTDQIRALRGLFKLKPGEKPVTQELIEEHAEDLRLEESKWKRFEESRQRERKLARRDVDKS